jgi:predicted ATPase
MAPNIERKKKYPPISKLTIQGYKSFVDPSSVELKKLTIFAGVNSSGKSSIIQPLLLLKQTLEESYDPGELLINGPHVKFTRMDQFLSKIGNEQSNSFSIEIEIEGKKNLKMLYEKIGKNLKIFQTDYIGNYTLFSNMTHDEYYNVNPQKNREYIEDFFRERLKKEDPNTDFELRAQIKRKRCFLEIEFHSKIYTRRSGGAADKVKDDLLGIIHVPALRGNPQRLYRKTFVGSNFPGTFEPYVSSILKKWMEVKDKRIYSVYRNLSKLNLTNKVKSSEIDDVSLNISVNRLPVSNHTKDADWISIADVGFGMSQTLPVIVALLQAQPGQIVYIEQPEIHLHPKAQISLAEILIEAANRGVQVIIETHSDSLILGLQTLTAEGKISPDEIKLHWFSRDEFGKTIIKSSNMDSIGSYGDWPEDFSDTLLLQRSKYLDAVKKVKFPKGS